MVIFIGFVLVFSIALFLYFNSFHASTESALSIQAVVSSESMNVAVRFIARENTSVTVLFRRLDGSSKPIAFLIANSTALRSCSDAVASIVGATLKTVSVSRRNIYVLSNGFEMPFYVYATGVSVPERIDVCMLYPEKPGENIVVVFNTPQIIYTAILISNKVYILNTYNYTSTS
jgi:hypothetical protein